jgi:uncharacterized membrane protein YphA (DoxX/SURF4 family)
MFYDAETRTPPSLAHAVVHDLSSSTQKPNHLQRDVTYGVTVDVTCPWYPIGISTERTLTMTTTPITTTRFSSSLLSFGLWLLQAFLAAVFLAHGWLFLAPPPDLLAIMNDQLTPAFRLFLGVAEVLAAIGLILPSVTRVLPRLTVWAAVGLMVVMVSATVLHTLRGETSSAFTTMVLLVLATLVAYGRSHIRPIVSRR